MYRRQQRGIFMIFFILFGIFLNFLLDMQNLFGFGIKILRISIFALKKRFFRVEKFKIFFREN